ncbi:hypothetical protein [Alkalicoccobacillus murimartini]|uniref:Uncharacterized protein n=1 Tax=Alkalicoccobacillus murimartini TaxID=171685 RepID=A0ABT9YM33_9BACI|nr:hypothetical protein [Alkalicoccobacillus murimartini]MDQ0208939.1 hypothetical protein [Alkalicoccobacillus murimartini]
MLEKIEAVKDALEKESYLPALSLALTLPDICGQIEYPEFYILRKGKKINLTGKQYKTWFDNWVNHRYADPSGWTEDFQKARNPYFTGAMCYDLRCSFLHSGNLSIGDFGESEDEEFNYSYEFELWLAGCNSFGESWTESSRDKEKIKKTRNVSIDISELCKNLCLSAEDYYKFKGKDAFKNNEIRVINIQNSPSRISIL